MVNMYSMGSMGMYNSMQGGNVHQYYKNKYGVGYEDFGSRPYVQPYPMAIVPISPKPTLERFWLGRFLKKCFFS